MKKILIVDDCSEVRELVKATLGGSEYSVIEASSGLKAVEMAIDNKPDLIIMDIVMPGGIDGIEAIRLIRKTPETDNCKIIILSGSGKNRVQEGYEAGACDYFVKPFSPLNLISKVDLLLEVE
ncbi:MAG: response regulator [Chitinispirillaceae bacterium]|nr:response regulator [Chitinispirillaceae bacterium]